MRSSIILGSLLATLAVAGPVDKRVLTTKVEIVTVWTTVTKGVAPTKLPGDSDRQGGSFPSGIQSVETSDTAEVKAPASTDAAIPSPALEEPKLSQATASSLATVPISEPAPAPVKSNDPAPSSPVPALVTSVTKNEVKSEDPAPPSPSPSPASSPLSSYAEKVLEQHNIHRANHTNTAPLTWSEQLAATALKTANTCVYKHDTKTDSALYEMGYGQNIGAGAPAEDVPAIITNRMYNGEAPLYDNLYGQADPDMARFKDWGHFSQIVWRNTKEVGCATVKCNPLVIDQEYVEPYYTVCNYAPPGNSGGQYGKNIGTPLGKAVVTI